MLHFTARFLATLTLVAVVTILAAGCVEDAAPVGGCSQDSECSRGYVCQSGICNQVPCATRFECPSDGQICLESGSCSATECLEDIDCQTDQLGVRCLDGVCLAACVSDADCADGLICVTDSGECHEGGPNNGGTNNGGTNNGGTNNGGTNNGGSGAAVCSSCTDSAECGGEGDECSLLQGGTFCTLGCETDNDCVPGFECAQTTTRSPFQCLPLGNSCSGCFLPEEACPEGQVCNPDSRTCISPRGNCERCSSGADCAEGGRCYQDGNLMICGSPCAGDGDCGANYTCQDRDGARVCVTSNACQSGGEDCNPPPQCSDPVPVVNLEFCTCVECENDGHCGDGLTCATNFRCLQSGGECENGADCPPEAQYCLGNQCVQCVTDIDCQNNGDATLCIHGACQACECPEGFRCDSRGNCIELGGDCESDLDCGDGQCHTDGTCYTPGACGSSDPFNSQCTAPTVCTQITLLGIIPWDICVGCTPQAGDCKNGEICIPSLDDPNTNICAGLSL